MRKFIMLAIAGFLLVQYGCKKPGGVDSPLPPTGGGNGPNPPDYEEYLECHINGEKWEPYLKPGLLGSIPKWDPVFLNDSIIVIRALRKLSEHNIYDYFEIMNFGVSNTGSYNFTGSMNSFYIGKNLAVNPPGVVVLDTFYCIPERSWLHISFLDTLSQRIAGEFAGELVNNSSDTLKLTQGRFDLIFDFYPRR